MTARVEITIVKDGEQYGADTGFTTIEDVAELEKLMEFAVILIKDTGAVE